MGAFDHLNSKTASHTPKKYPKKPLLIWDLEILEALELKEMSICLPMVKIIVSSPQLSLLRSLFSLLMTLKRLLLRPECVAKDKLTLSRVTLCKESMPSPPNTNKPFTQQFFQSQSPQGYFLRQTN